ncbi:unnamed protein product, partial [Prunus brigantina]
MNIGSSSQNPRCAMERDQAALQEGLDSEESDARQSADASTTSRCSRSANSVQTWEQMENVFHDYYFRIQPEVTISDLAALKQSEDEPAQDFITRDFIQEGITAIRLKLAEKPPSVTTDPFPQPQVNMVNLNWPEQKRCKLTVEASLNIGRRVTREANQRPKATISAGVVLCSNQPTASVFDRIGTSYQQGPVLAPPRDIAGQRAYQRLVQCNKKLTE